MTALPDPPPPRAPGRRRRAALAPSARIAVLLGRWAGAVSRCSGRGRGSTLPGRVALCLVPGLLGQLTGSRSLVLVSGTNGKSTTSRYLTLALETRGPVLSNSAGSNMRGGLATVLMAPGAPGDPVVLEIDEHVLTSSAGELQPRMVVLLNLTRDQLDRTGEVGSHVRGWAAALAQVPGAVVVANADDPLVCAAVLSARPDSAAVRWVAVGQPWRRDCPLCPMCDDAWGAPRESWACAGCGFARPAPVWQLEGDRVDGPAGTQVRLRLGLPGRANLANATMAVAAAAELGVPAAVGAVAMSAVSEVDGRYLSVGYAGTPVRLLLAKNPAGWAEVLGELAEQRDQLVIAVNSRAPDGGDMSWLWDVPFEQLQGRQVVASGERSADVALRLLYAGVAHTREPDVLRALRRMPPKATQVIANYTAFTGVRDQLRGDASGPRAA